MSAYLVNDRHIAYLIAYGLRRNWTGSPLRWMVPAPKPAGVYQQGEPWGPESSEHYAQVSRELTRETADCVGHMLLEENYKSVNHRYAEQGEPETFFQYREPKVLEWNPVQVLKSINCLVYQSCEHPEWDFSEARAFLEALKERAIHNLPGYDKAEWGPPPDIAEVERRVKAAAAETVARAAFALKEEEERLERKRAVGRLHRKEAKERKAREAGEARPE